MKVFEYKNLYSIREMIQWNVMKTFYYSDISSNIGTKNNELICLGTKDDIKDMFVKVMDKPGDNGNLLFSEVSRFPRYKLKDTSYNRVLKIEDADHVVYNPGALEISNDYYQYTKSCGNIVFKLKGHLPIILLSSHDIYNILSHAKWYDDLNSMSEDKLKGFVKKVITRHNINADTYKTENITKIPDAEIEWIYHGAITTMHYAARHLMEGISSGIYTSVIKDSDLEKKVSRFMKDIDRDNFTTLISLLESDDYITSEVGWKMLTGMNAMEYPTLIKCLFYIYRGHMSKAVYNSVGIQSLMSALNIKIKSYEVEHKGNPIIDKSTVAKMCEDAKYSDKEAYFMKILIKKYIGILFNESFYNICYPFQGFVEKLDISIKFKD